MKTRYWRCFGLRWKECPNDALPGKNFCAKHLREHEQELDRLAAMARCGWSDEYGSD